MDADAIRRAVGALSATNAHPMFSHDYPPRLVWHQDNEDPSDVGGWIIELGAFGAMHPYFYVDMCGEDDPLSQEIIQRTNYRNRNKLGDKS